MAPDTPSQAMPDNGAGLEAWYLLHTKPRQEEVALTNLQRQGYECYLPRMRVQRVRQRKARVVVEPMFSRYLFIRLGTSGHGKSWAPIRSTVGVTRLVHFGTCAARVDDALVHLLQQREEAMPTAGLFGPGDTVVIVDGPFAGIEAIYCNHDGEQRALILIDLLGKSVPMLLDAGKLVGSSPHH